MGKGGSARDIPLRGLKGGDVKAREIAARDWPAFLSAFTHLHRGQPATVRMWDPSLRAEARTGELPLDSVVTGRSSAPEISIHMGTDSRRHLEFGVEKPARVWPERADSGEEDLEIEAASGARTLVECRAATH